MSTATKSDTNMLLLRDFLKYCLNQVIDDLKYMMEDPDYIDTTGNTKMIIEFLSNSRQIRYCRTESQTTESFYHHWLELMNLSFNGTLDAGLQSQGQQRYRQIMMIIDSIENAQMYGYKEEDDTFTPEERRRINDAMQMLGYLEKKTNDDENIFFVRSCPRN